MEIRKLDIICLGIALGLTASIIGMFLNVFNPPYGVYTQTYCCLPSVIFFMVAGVIVKSGLICPHCLSFFSMHKINEEVEADVPKTETGRDEQGYYKNNYLVRHVLETFECSKCGGRYTESKRKVFR